MSTHINHKFLDQCRQLGDVQADSFVEYCFGNKMQQEFYDLLKFAGTDSEFKKLKIILNSPKEASALFNSKLIFDEAKLNLGSAFFQDHAREILFLLGSLSLPYCYAAAKGAKVLCFSDRIISNPEKRLTETAAFVIKVMEPNAFAEHGKGRLACSKIRLIHAMVRYHIKLSGKWNEMEEKPINQEDMAGTNLSFSIIVLRGLRKMGVSFTDEEAESYLYLWSIIGACTGVITDLLPFDRKSVFDLERKIASRQFKISNEGRMLSNSLVNFLKKSSPIKLLQSQQENIMHFLLGEKVSDIIAIKKTGSTRVSSFLVSNVKQMISMTDYKRIKLGLEKM